MERSSRFNFPRDFKGVWIPKEIYLNEELSWTEKLLFIEIDSLNHKEKGCFASNKYFANLFGISEKTVSVSISRLKKLGLIKQESYDGRTRVLRLYTNVKSDFTLLYSPTDSDIILNNNKKIYTSPPIAGGVLSLASLLAKSILKNNPNSIQLSEGRYDKTVKRWATDLDKLHRIDKQTLSDIRSVILWSQSDNFWKTNILSGAALRKQWDKLYIASKKSTVDQSSPYHELAQQFCSYYKLPSEHLPLVATNLGFIAVLHKKLPPGIMEYGDFKDFCPTPQKFIQNYFKYLERQSWIKEPSPALLKTSSRVFLRYLDDHWGAESNALGVPLKTLFSNII